MWGSNGIWTAAINLLFTLMGQAMRMAQLPEHLTPERWLAQLLSSGEARKGGVVKRQIRDVERIVGREAFVDEIERRGFQVLENGRHFIVFCNDAPIRRVRPQPATVDVCPVRSAFERAF